MTRGALILPWRPAVAISASRGNASAPNLLTRSPKEVWLDTAVGTAATIDLDLGAPVPVDTVFLGHVTPPAVGAVWTITGGLAGYTELALKAAGPLRAIDRAGMLPATSHGFWTGAEQTVRYLRLAVTQPGGSDPISAGIAMAGKAFQTEFGHEWGSGRAVIDTATVTPLSDGGFAVVEGARKGSWRWTFGDLSDAETDQLYALQLELGESRPVLIAENPEASDGQLWRLHYARLTGLRQFERRHVSKTRWELAAEDWA